MRPYIVAGIFARGGSKGVPRKNVRLIAGKPLIAYAIETALSSAMVSRVIVSTDDPETAEIALEYGADVPFVRPAELARDDSPEWVAWQHAIRVLEGRDGGPRWDVFACVPPTAPLREVQDLDACISKLLSGDADIVITVKPSERSPYFNMVTIDSENSAHLVIQPERGTHRRQDTPRVFDITTVAYAAKPAFIMASSGMFQGRVEAVEVPAERAIDIDTELDFRVAEFLLRERP